MTDCCLKALHSLSYGSWLYRGKKVGLQSECAAWCHKRSTKTKGLRRSFSSGPTPMLPIHIRTCKTQNAFMEQLLHRFECNLLHFIKKGKCSDCRKWNFSLEPEILEKSAKMVWKPAVYRSATLHQKQRSQFCKLHLLRHV